MDIYRSTRLQNKANSNLRMKASSLYFLNDISNMDSVDGPDTCDNWRDAYTFNPRIIGRGHFSKVYKVKCCSTGNNAAIKIIRRRRLGTDKIDEIMQEIEIMQLLNKSSNSGFIQLMKVHTSPSEVAIVMEFASGGSLYQVTQESQTGLPEVYVKIVLMKILSALSVIHRQDIVHLDIKADNILLRYPYQSTDVVLIDFGLARRLTKSKVHKEMIGTPDYIAPEVLSYDQISLKSDMWSVGVLAYFLLTNVSPFSGDSKDDTLNRVTKTQFDFVGHLKEDNMHLARNFICSLLVKIPENRLSSEQGMLHDFLMDIPIIESLPEKLSLTSKAPVVNLDYGVHIRPNTSYHTRGLVMSQYDIGSSDRNQKSIFSDMETFSLHSIECLGEQRAAESCDMLSIDKRDEAIVNSEQTFEECDGVDSKDSIYQEDEVLRNSDQVFEEAEDIYDRRIPIDMVISQIMESSNDNVIGEVALDITKGRDEQTMCDQNSNLSSCNEINLSTKFMNLPFLDKTESSVSEMTTTSLFNPIPSDKDKNESDSGGETSSSEFIDLTIRTDPCKQNNQTIDTNIPGYEMKEGNGSCTFPRTEIYESRRRLNPVVNESYRCSREHIIEPNNNNPSKSFLVRHFSTLDGPITDRSTSSVSRRVHLSRSLKRNSDKPNAGLDKWKRRSEVNPIPNPMYDKGKFNKHPSLTKSATVLVTSKNEKKKSQSKLERMLSSIKPKKSDKCSIS